jgi:Trk K+ transport system NAD-binding subunit
LYRPAAALYSSEGYNVEEPVLICGFGGVGQTVANMLLSPTLGRPQPYVAFDLTVGRVQAAQEAGFNVLYGDGSRTKVLHAAGIERPKAIVVGHTARQRAVTAVECLREAFPDVPIYVRALDIQHAAKLQEAGGWAGTGGWGLILLWEVDSRGEPPYGWPSGSSRQQADKVNFSVGI